MRASIRMENVKKVEIGITDLLNALEIDPQKYTVVDARLGVTGIDFNRNIQSLFLNVVERPYETGK